MPAIVGRVGRRDRFRTRWLAAILAGLAACVPGPGACRLPALHGRVVDADTGAPIAGATVIEWWRGAGVGGAPQPTRHIRFATSDASGRFAFPAATAPSLRLWALRAYEPIHGFVHPDYGLVRGPERRDAEGRLVLRGSRSDAAARLGDLEVLCTSPPRDDADRELARRVCSARRAPPARQR
jgi:hypothetical protein